VSTISVRYSRVSIISVRYPRVSIISVRYPRMSIISVRYPRVSIISVRYPRVSIISVRYPRMFNNQCTLPQDVNNQGTLPQGVNNQCTLPPQGVNNQHTRIRSRPPFNRVNNIIVNIDNLTQYIIIILTLKRTVNHTFRTITMQTFLYLTDRVNVKIVLYSCVTPLSEGKMVINE
jgi:hypothetical protein